MVEQIERVTKVVEGTQAPTAVSQETRQVTQASVAPSTLIARVIWYITGILLVLLAFRFVLALLGANPANGFADFIYTTSHPFVAPFFSLFGYNLRYGVARFEIFTLIAMGVYALIAFGLAKLVTLNSAERHQV